MSMPRYAQNAIMNQGQGGQGGGAGGNDLFGSALSLIHGYNNNNEDPYKKGFEATQPYYNQAVNAQNPFAKQGQQALGANQEWLNNMKDPQAFISHLMSQYQQSPWARNLQNESVRAGTNAASAAGLTGSTPFAQQLQQNASTISSADQNNWLSNVLGINTKYGEGLNNQIQTGQHSSDILSQLFGNQGDLAGGQAYGSQNYENEQENNNWNNWGNFLGAAGTTAAQFI